MSALRRINVSAAQLLIADATPVLLVPAPPAGSLVLPSSVVLDFNDRTTPYNADAEVTIRWGSAAQPAFGSASSFPFSGGNPWLAIVLGQNVATSIQEAPDSFLGAQLELILQSAITTGDGSMVVTVTYDVVGA